MKRFRTIYRLVIGGTFVSIIIVGLYFIIIKWNTCSLLEKKKEEQEAINLELEEKTKELLKKKELFYTDPSFVEKTAREAGMIKPGEVVFKVSFTNYVSDKK